MNKLLKHSATAVACLCTTSALATPNALEGATSAREQAPRRAARVVSYAAESGAIESVFLREDLGASGERLTGLTHLAEGARVWEEALFDHAGRLVRAESVCSLRSGDSVTLTFEPIAGVVETRSADGFHRWSVPTDHDWAWLPAGCGDDARTGSVTTPVAALVAARASKQHSALRLIDPHRFASHTITSDQVIVPEDARSAWVVLGDDAVLVQDDVPLRWHANALDVDVEQR